MEKKHILLATLLLASPLAHGYWTRLRVISELEREVSLAVKDDNVYKNRYNTYDLEPGKSKTFKSTYRKTYNGPLRLAFTADLKKPTYFIYETPPAGKGDLQSYFFPANKGRRTTVKIGMQGPDLVIWEYNPLSIFRKNKTKIPLLKKRVMQKPVGKIPTGEW